MSCGVPVAAFPVPGPRDVIGDAPVGVLDDDLRAAALRALTIDRSACRAFAERMDLGPSARMFLDNVAIAAAAGGCRRAAIAVRRFGRSRARRVTTTDSVRRLTPVLAAICSPARDAADEARMFVTFFHELKSAGVPVTLREYLTLMEAMDKDLASRRVEDFYYLSRATLVKDERNLDKFDRVFGHVFKGLELMEEALTAEIPEEWLKKLDREISDRGREEADRGDGRPRQADGDVEEAARRAEGPPPGRHRNGSAPAAPRRSAMAATTRKASASAARARIAAR